MKATGLKRGTCALAVLGLLAGCAETELAVHNAKRLQEPGSAATTQMGAYKVGKPYQIANVWYYPHEDYTYDESGIASWYGPGFHGKLTANGERSEEHTSELQSLMRISYAVFCLKKKTTITKNTDTHTKLQ